MIRRSFIRVAAAVPVLGLAPAFSMSKTVKKPNIIYIMADDLGYAELGCYGQTKIQTPNIDRLCTEGIKLTQHYSGNPVCAPSRCSLMTGLHTGHTQIRGNKQIGGNENWKLGATGGGQYPLMAGTVTVARILQDAGYKTGAFGKWGLGTVASSGDPQKQGFDHFHGYICQRQAHTHYPNHLWKDGEIDWIKENEGGKEVVHSHDVMAQSALDFIKTCKDGPFFCYVPFTIPHVSIQVPEESLAQYRGKFEEPKPFEGSSLYFPNPTPRAGYAAMITHMDKDVGRIMDLVDELGLAENTLIIFTSDNGPTFNGGSDSEFFESAKPLNGLKGSVYEGGIRIPYIAKWKGRITPGTESDHMSAFWDFLPTCCEMIGEKPPKNIDGISMLPALLGDTKNQTQHKYLYWELGNQQAIRAGDWKLLRSFDKKSGKATVELFNIANDIAEQHNLAKSTPEKVAELLKMIKENRTVSPVFKLALDDI
jgi:arylsulfatase A